MEKKIGCGIGLLCLLALCVAAQDAPPFSYDCPGKAITPPPKLPDKAVETFLTAPQIESLRSGARKPELLFYRELKFEHHGVSMPQWSLNGRWLAVQCKPPSRRTPYQIKLFHFPPRAAMRSYTLQNERQQSVFYDLCWCPDAKRTEFCMISGGFRLFWGRVDATRQPVVKVQDIYRRYHNVTHPDWLRIGKQDYILFLEDGKINVGILHDAEDSKDFEPKMPLWLSKDGIIIARIDDFDACATEDEIRILFSGSSRKGPGLFIATLSAYDFSVISLKKVGEGTYKLPRWDSRGNRAVAYCLNKVARGSSAQELFLYLYSPEGSGDLFRRAPTIMNREKEPEHDYLGVSWGHWKIGTAQYSGIAHFFKRSDSKQHYKLISFSGTDNSAKFESTKFDFGDFPAFLGRGRRIAFAGAGSSRVAFVFYDPRRQKNILYLGLINFPITKN